ncbi:EIF3G isoform 8 [Pan troglodytes]|uniref:Eukaryotic translation initiation factor 3 subunit G n=3 Tax=Hominidae TaxID=9604 RepID=K7ERL8_HUMAN|nr:EIF3G isoform 8 [Pan troglodytes]PNJ14534.1 EIF3G isoform 8 [Pongo abelii]
MPTGDFDSKPSWADQVEEEGEDGVIPKALPSQLGSSCPWS